MTLTQRRKQKGLVVLSLVVTPLVHAPLPVPLAAGALFVSPRRTALDGLDGGRYQNTYRPVRAR